MSSHSQNSALTFGHSFKITSNDQSKSRICLSDSCSKGAAAGNHTASVSAKPFKIQQHGQQLSLSGSVNTCQDYENTDQIFSDREISTYCDPTQPTILSSMTSPHSTTNYTASMNEKPNENNEQRDILSSVKSRSQQQRQVRFNSLLTSNTVISESDENNRFGYDSSYGQSGQELIDLSIVQTNVSSSSDAKLVHCDRGLDRTNRKFTNHPQTTYNPHTFQTSFSDVSDNEIFSDKAGNFFDSDNDDNEPKNIIHHVDRINLSDRQIFNDDIGERNISDLSPSHHKLKIARQRTFLGRLLTNIESLSSNLISNVTSSPASASSGAVNQIPYASYDSEQDNHQATSANNRKYRFLGASASSSKQHNHHLSERLFRGSYRYSRLGIVMALLKRLISFLFQRSTLSLFGAFLIHITLGTIYTLSNVNSYLTSYMRKHGTPNATYGSSMWISSSYAVGQGLSMVLGGYLEKRFSARLACILGCLLHSASIMSTSISIDYGQLAVFTTYGLLPGFGCGLAYMTPMSNGFGWFPHRRGIVAGTILAGFGIGTFVFNMAQTAYVNPDNLSPPPDSGGYFTQEIILKNVPHLFVFLGSIYASMQFIGCCLMFKPPSPSLIDSISKVETQDDRPLLSADANEIGAGPTGLNYLAHLPFKKAIRTREFIVLFIVFGVTNQGVLFVNSMLKEYAQKFINDDMYLAWTGSMASVANSMGRLMWGLAIDRYSFTQCFTAITTIFGLLMFIMPFEFILSSKILYLICTLGIFGSFSGWMSTYPVHLSRVFGVKNAGMVYGLIFVSQSIGGIITAFGAHYLIDHFSRFVPFFTVTFLEVFGLVVYHLFYFK